MTHQPFAVTEQEIKARTELIATIEAAFNGVSREGGVSLHEAGVIAEEGSNAERLKARLRDTESCWQDVPEEDLRKEMSENTFLDPIGFRYYLPAFLILCVTHFRGDIPRIHEWMVYAFTHSTPEAQEQVSLLNRAQRGVVSRFLDFYRQFDPESDYVDIRLVHKALANGWEQYL